MLRKLVFHLKTSLTSREKTGLNDSQNLVELQAEVSPDSKPS
jgi:hypothetical protein